MNLQPTLENDTILLAPLEINDFEALYQIASDPLVWEQHPNKNRYQKEVFQSFFEGAIASKGAFKIIDKKDQKIIGSTRFYNLDSKNNSVLIGYTFYGRAYWGSQYNPQVKNLMLNHAFKYVENVLFHIGAMNIRSQKAIERLGAVQTKIFNVAYHGESETLNFEYLIEKKNWESK
ncbi:GNAT family N-acetyltransferase [Flavobacterium sp.]|uniref:GNAT family N-acetyltransferase n=1 Tax=Flavobacterium sp. TaxID=239 RepID=UPI003D125437